MSGVVDTLAEIWRKLGRVKGREGNGAVKYKIHSDKYANKHMTTYLYR